MPKTKSRSHDKAYVLVEATRLLKKRSNGRLKRKVRDLALARGGGISPL